MLAVFVDCKRDNAPVWPSNFLGFKIDSQSGVGATIGIVHQLFKFLRRDLDWQDAVLEAIVVKDVGKTRRNYAADAEVQQRQIGRAHV